MDLDPVNTAEDLLSECEELADRLRAAAAYQHGLDDRTLWAFHLMSAEKNLRAACFAVLPIIAEDRENGHSASA